MDQLLVKLVENTPVLAVLCIVLIVVFQQQKERDLLNTKEREQFISTNLTLSESVRTISIQMTERTQALQDFTEMSIQAFTYMKSEHEQMIKLLEKLNDK